MLGTVAILILLHFEAIATILKPLWGTKNLEKLGKARWALSFNGKSFNLFEFEKASLLFLRKGAYTVFFAIKKEWLYSFIHLSASLVSLIVGSTLTKGSWGWYHSTQDPCKISPNWFIVRVNNHADRHILRFFLLLWTRQFSSHHILSPPSYWWRTQNSTNFISPARRFNSCFPLLIFCAIDFFILMKLLYVVTKT